eukprot:scaffold78573_cov36-Prasinocladus_malaysianus.AAC.2
MVERECYYCHKKGHIRPQCPKVNAKEVKKTKADGGRAPSKAEPESGSGSGSGGSGSGNSGSDTAMAANATKYFTFAAIAPDNNQLPPSSPSWWQS